MYTEKNVVMKNSQQVIVELTPKIPLIKKYTENHGNEVERLLIALNKINCKCLLIGPTYASLRDGDPYHFRVQVEAAFSSPNKKELTHHFTSSNTTAILTLSSFFRRLREKLQAGYTITEYEESVDFSTAVWYRFNRKTFLFESV